MTTTTPEEAKKVYITPRWVQAWFLKRSRDNWKEKYMGIKKDSKRLHNRVNDVTKSREKWRQETLLLRQRVAQLEAQTNQLQEELEAKKKGGPGTEVGSVPR
jgi:predicted  nucleic acid-binding Zn-ribbon protein